MIKYLLGFVLISPLIGVIMMEFGAYSLAAHEFGYQNNVSFAYALYVLLFVLSFRITGKFNFKLPRINTLNANYKTIAFITIFINLFFLFLILFVFGGYKVLLGHVDKGAFRIGFGFFGVFVHLMTKMFLPSILVLNVFYFKKENKSTLNISILILNFVLAFIFGASWGYKSTAIFILLPPLILLYEKPKFIKILLLSILSFFFIVLFAMFFDNAKDISTNDIDLFSEVVRENPIESVLYRLTVLQGDPCWKIWDLYINGELKNVEYHKTLYSIMGDGNLNRFLGINHENYPLFIQYHFGLLLTFLCGNEPSAIAQGYSVTGTVFTEGIVAGGMGGLVFFSFIAGFITKIVVMLIKKGYENNLPVLTAMMCTYFCFYIFTWLNGGGIELLFHISVFIGLSLNFLLLVVLLNISKYIKL
jgi:hypothetical protein